MQSVINCTHYIYGEGEKEYLNTAPFPELNLLTAKKLTAWMKPGWKKLITINN